MIDRPSRRARLAPILALFLLLAAPACGGGGAPAPTDPFEVTLPDDPAGGGGSPGETPPPPPSLAPSFTADAWVHARTALFGSFPSDLVLHGTTVWTNDADQVEKGGARLVPLDVSGPVPRPSEDFAEVVIEAGDLVDSHGTPADVDLPIGYGFFVNDLAIATADLGFALVSAGGSDTDPTLSNLVVFDPRSGGLLQRVDLAQVFPAGTYTASDGTAPPPTGFVQSGAEALLYLPTGPARGRLYVAMTNFLFGAPSYGATKWPGTVQAYDVRTDDATPVRALSGGGLATRTTLLDGYNPVALQPIVAEGSRLRLLVTLAGATGYDADFALVATTPASVQVFDAATLAYLGRFDLGLAGLAATRPALGFDATGHRVGFYPSAVNGEVYLLRLDGLFSEPIDEGTVAVLRGPGAGIPIAPDDAGGPGANVTAVAILGGGRWLAVAGFGDLFAFPAPRPGRLYLLQLPPDLVTGAGFGTNFVPGWTQVETLPGRALGALVRPPPGPGRPDLLVTVSGRIDATTFGGTSPASVGTLHLRGLSD